MTLSAAGDEFETALTSAALDGRLEAHLGVAADPPGQGFAARADQLADACRAIRAANNRQRTVVVAALHDAGIKSARPSEAFDGRPVRGVGIEVDPDERQLAVEHLREGGFASAGPHTSAAWESYQRTLPGCVLHPDDETDGRIDLRWGPGPGRPGHRLLHPDQRDWRHFDLARRWWWIYHLVHFVKLPHRIATRRRSSPDLGPFLGTPLSLIPDLLQLAGVGPDDVVVDLGCGDGRVLVEAVERTGCRARGVELDPVLCDQARSRVAAAGLADRIEVEEADAAATSLAGASVVFVFLPASVAGQIIPDLVDQLDPGGRVICHEQERIESNRPPNVERVIASDDALTVARLWLR